MARIPDMSAEEAYDEVYSRLIAAGCPEYAAEIKFWHDQANYWMSQYGNVIGEH